jgi:hypothetical protein
MAVGCDGAAPGAPGFVAAVLEDVVLYVAGALVWVASCWRYMRDSLSSLIYKRAVLKTFNLCVDI